MKFAYIMRGVPGSGKSTVAKKLVTNEGIIHSTDDYFYTDNEYCFKPSMLPAYHAQNLAAFCDSVAQGIPTVICDNTNVLRQHYEPYISAAKENGYVVVFVIMPHPDPQVAASRTTHGVPVEAIQRMINSWEA